MVIIIQMESSYQLQVCEMSQRDNDASACDISACCGVTGV